MLLIIIFLINHFYLRKFFYNKKAKEEEIEIEKIDYNKKAKEDLEKLKEKIDLLKYRDFCFEVTFIIKIYLANKYNFNCQDLTTKEILLYPNILESEKKLIKDFLKQLDLVKFANNEIDKLETLKIYNLAFTIVS